MGDIVQFPPDRIDPEKRPLSRDNQLIINVRDGHLKMSMRHPVESFDEFITIMMTLILGAANNIVARAPEDARYIAKEELFDTINIAASHTLKQFAPEFDLRPHLTEQAILEAENSIMKREIASRAKNNPQ